MAGIKAMKWGKRIRECEISHDSMQSVVYSRLAQNTCDIDNLEMEVIALKRRLKDLEKAFEELQKA